MEIITTGMICITIGWLAHCLLAMVLCRSIVRLEELRTPSDSEALRKRSILYQLFLPSPRQIASLLTSGTLEKSVERASVATPTETRLTSEPQSKGARGRIHGRQGKNRRNRQRRR